MGLCAKGLGFEIS